MIRRSSFYCTSWVRSIGFRRRGRKGGRERGREGERERGREGEREGGREEGREGERERGRERGLIHVHVYWWGVLLFGKEKFKICHIFY